MGKPDFVVFIAGSGVVDQSVGVEDEGDDGLLGKGGELPLVDAGAVVNPLALAGGKFVFSDDDPILKATGSLFSVLLPREENVYGLSGRRVVFGFGFLGRRFDSEQEHGKVNVDGRGFGHQKGFMPFARFADDGVFDEGVAKIDLGGEGDFPLARVKADFANLKFSGTGGLDERFGFLGFFFRRNGRRFRASGLRCKQ